MKDKSFSWEEFRKVIDKLESEGLRYFVFGGFAYDFMKGEIGEHEDLDISFFIEDQEKARQVFRDLGYIPYKHGNKDDYRKGKCKVDVIFIEDGGDYYIIGGNVCLDQISKEAFEKNLRAEIGMFSFSIFPYEWFSLYFDKHYIPEKREKTNEAISKILPLCKNLKVLKQVPVERPENMELIEV